MGSVVVGVGFVDPGRAENGVDRWNRWGWRWGLAAEKGVDPGEGQRRSWVPIYKYFYVNIYVRTIEDSLEDSWVT